MTETEFFQKYRGQLEEHCKAGPISGWTDGNFVKLSEEISEATHILISKNTLKRLFGKIKVPDDYKPQRETRNALAMYLGYRNWDDFCIKNKPDGEEYIASEIQSGQGKRTGRISPWLYWPAAVVLGGVFLLVWKPWEEKMPPRESFGFSIKNPVDTVPFTLVVNYDVSQLPPDSGNLNLDGKIYLNKDRHTITSNIVLPTYRWITLRNGPKELKSLPIHCLSRGWQWYIGNEKSATRLNSSDLLPQGKGGIKPEYFVLNPGLDSNDLFLDVRNTKNFGVSGDDFRMEVIMKTTRKGNSCKGTTFRVFGEHGHHEVRLYPQGCRQHNFIVTGEKVFLGRYEDLTQIPFEKDRWNSVVLESRNRSFSLQSNGIPSFKETYKKPLGEIKGVFINTDIHSLIESIKIWDSKGVLIENQEF